MENFLSTLFILLVLLCVSSTECNSHPIVAKKERKLINGVLSMTCPFEDLDTNANESKTWNVFLNSLYCKFSEYKIQVAKRSYRVNNTENFGKQDCEIEHLIDEIQRRDIDENNFEIFLNKTVKCNIMEYDRIKNIVVTGKETEELNHVLDFTLRDKIHVNCVGTHIFIKGNYITAGDITDILFLKRKMKDGKCKNFFSTGKTKFLNIFALNTFFIDVSINSSTINSRKIALMSVIAPMWENIGKNKIELNGEDAELPEKGNGLDGKPGKPGGPGRNFFGIGSVFINGKSLEIAVNGGKGSHGEEGRKGGIGVDGSTPTTPSPQHYDCRNGSSKHRLCEGNRKIADFSCKEVQCKYETHALVNQFNAMTWCKYEIFGKMGTIGKNGGKGGRGGKGGYPGNIGLIELNEYSYISQFKNTGQNGADGKGGAGGLGGKKGNDITVKCDSNFWKTDWYIVSTRSSNVRAESGQNGLNGGNSNGMEYPKSADIIHILDRAKIINQYKIYLRENLYNSITNSLLSAFLNEIETNTKVKKVYNTLGFIDDVQQLEEQFHTLNKDIDFLPFYQSLLNRISEYSKDLKEIGDLREYKMVLCYLYTAILGRIYNMQDNIESNLIIDIHAYLSSVKNDMDKLKDLKNAKHKERLIQKYKYEYKHEIDVKINEAKELISKEIAPEIDKIGTEIDIQMENLVNEVVYLQDQTEKEHKELREKQTQLKNVLGLQGVFSVFKIFGNVVSSLGPLGAIAGSVIETGSTIAESFIANDLRGRNEIFKLPQSVSELESINERIKNTLNQKAACLKNSLLSISLQIFKYSDILSNMAFKILSIKARLDKLDKNKLNFRELQALEEELEIILKKEEEESDPKNSQKLAIITNLKRIVQLSSLLSKSYNKYKNNPEKLDTIISAIEGNEEKLKMLKEYELKIYNSIMPTLQNIQNDIQVIISKLGTKSKVNLDITKWHVQSTLRNMLLIIHQLTRGFKVEDNLARCIEKLEETINALINVHEHIHDYQKDQNLANYIAEISSLTSADIIIGNNVVLQEELRNAVRNLEITVRSNIVLQRYKIAMNAFKQFVFPFAHNYFKDLILPSHLRLIDDKGNTTLDNLVYKAGVEIEKISSKLEDYKNTVTHRDGCIGTGEFQNGYVSTKPFFVWKNGQYKNMISKLLSGNAVMVKADVRDSAPYKDAVKFNVINFNFVSKNESLQSEINNKLKRFQVTAYHLGNSGYRYENKIYEMMTASQEIWYYFEKKANGEPVHYSLSYKKIMNGNLTLSPYASWKIKLDHVLDDVSFEDLEVYKDSVDLTLEGYGYFLNKRSRNCIDLMVDKYYKTIGAFYYADSYVESDEVDSIYPMQNNIFRIYRKKNL